MVLDWIYQQWKIWVILYGSLHFGDEFVIEALHMRNMEISGYYSINWGAFSNMTTHWIAKTNSLNFKFWFTLEVILSVKLLSPTFK